MGASGWGVDGGYLPVLRRLAWVWLGAAWADLTGGGPHVGGELVGGRALGALDWISAG